MENHKNISNLERPRIKLERRTGHNYSYYIDANGLLKGEWGGFKNDYGKGENGEQIFGVFYKSNYIPINEFGYFYNKFDCREFDVVYKFTEGFYICIKNNLFGIIDNDGYCILPANYKNVQAYNLSCWICIVTTDTGKFIYNVSTKETSTPKFEKIRAHSIPIAPEPTINTFSGSELSLSTSSELKIKLLSNSKPLALWIVIKLISSFILSR